MGISCKCSNGREVHNCTKPFCKYCCEGGQPLNNAYSVLGGVVATKNAEYTMPSMSNPNAERPVKRINTEIPSLTNLGGIGDMKDFNPYNSVGTYKDNVNFMQNDVRIPKKFGGTFYSNVNLEQPSGSPVLQSKGINMGGFGGGGTPQGKIAGFCTGKCERPRGFLRRKEKARCLSSGSGCQCSFNDGSTLKCGRDAR
mgnify:CR=1 FL=1